MKKLVGIGIFFLMLLLAFSGCYYDNEETLYPQGICDTIDVKYSDQVIYIISNKCYDCHSNATAPISGSNESYEGYANISAYLTTNTPTFIGAINHEVGTIPMPKDRPKLTDCEIRTLEIWIQDGFPNN
jgi:hypothetical protein